MKKMFIIIFIVVLILILFLGVKKYNDSQYIYVTVEFKKEINYELLENKYKMKNVFEANFSHKGNVLRGKIKEDYIKELEKEKEIKRVVEDLIVL